MGGLKERATEKKRGGKGAVYATKPQSHAHFRVGKGMRRDPKITQYKIGRIRIGKYDKSAYGVIIRYFPCTLSSANKLVYAVIDVYPLLSMFCPIYFLCCRPY